MNDITVTIALDDAREIARLLDRVTLDGLRGATLTAARELLADKIARAIDSHTGVITITKKGA